MAQVGRPPKFESVEQLQNLIDAYFESCWEINNDGKNIQVRPYTITGLANALDTTRETLLDYQEKDEFSDTIKRAKSIVEQYVEEYLFTGKNQTGAIFNLKNNYKGWKDKTEQDVTSGGKPIVIDHDLLIKNATNTSTETNS